MENKNRYIYIDIIKVWACVGVFIYHSILGTYRYNNLYIFESSKTILSIFISFLHYFHVPTFFFCSGFLFSISYKKIDTTKKYLFFVLKKLYTLGIPFITFSLAYSLLNGFFSSHNNYKIYRINTFWDVFTHPVAQYWYLLTLFEILVISPIILFFFKLKNLHLLLFLISLIYIIMALFGTELSFLKYLFIFFLGIFINNKKNNNHCVIPSLTLILMFILIYLTKRFLLQHLFLKCCSELFFSTAIVLSFYFLIKYAVEEKNITFGKKLIRYIFHIYLLHTWVIGVAKIFLSPFNLYCEPQIILISIIGFFITYIVSVFIKKINILNFWFEPTLLK